MLIGEPPRSQGDLNFTVLGIPVRIHPFFWIIAFLLGIGASRDREGQVDPASMLLWICVVFVSILVHELGHALTARKYGRQPWITLYGLGGLASYGGGNIAPRDRIRILLAGPGAGFLFAAVVLAGIVASGHQIELRPHIMPVRFEFYEGSRYLNILILDLLFVNIVWGVLNLLPVYPLDGGQITREILVEKQPYEGVKLSLWISVVTAGALAVVALVYGELFVTLMFGYLAYTSYATLQAYSGRGGGPGW